MTAILEGLSSFADLSFWVFILLGMLLGLLVGLFPGVTMTMAVALASGFTLTLEPEQGLAVLLTIYVAGQFGDRIPSILINTPGTPASIATTFDGYPMAKKGNAGLALMISGIATGVGILASMVLFVLVAQPIASFALRFGPAEMFALVLFGLTVMISIASKSLLKGLLAGVFGLLLAVVGRDPITGSQRLTFGIDELSSGIEFIAVIIGLFGIAEVLDQIITHRPHAARPISSLGRWWPTKKDLRESLPSGAIGGAVGLGVGIVPAAGGDIAGLIGWDRARSASKHPEKFGTGYVGGVAASDTASSATLGGSLTTTMALGIPGDSVMAVMIGSMIVWGIQPGPSLFTERPDMVVLIAAIMVIATLATTVVSLIRVKGMVKLLDMKPQYLWPVILIFCMVGTYATTNSMMTVTTMLIAGFVGLGLKRANIPAGPVVLGLLLGPLAESNLRRALLIDGPGELVSSWISIVLLALTAIVLVGALLRRDKSKSTAAEPAHDVPAS
ncbi:tripartite tricarboxylate transporter permease [Georgenia sp. MJ170]|uniref:tripartite tricarboxylate transporter permease n=1 Tax=Georgenia sunbinii TaxID=3117728 RepID=UPI002F26D432